MWLCGLLVKSSILVAHCAMKLQARRALVMNQLDLCDCGPCQIKYGGFFMVSAARG
jgi:hypothetical protein